MRTRKDTSTVHGKPKEINGVCEGLLRGGRTGVCHVYPENRGMIFTDDKGKEYRFEQEGLKKANRRRWPITICGGLLFPQAGRKSLGKREVIAHDMPSSHTHIIHKRQ